MPCPASWGGDVITRHNRLRDVVAAVAEEGGLNPILEKKGILGHTDEASRRPADVAIPTWCSGKGLAIDVAVISTTAPTNMRVPDPIEAYGRLPYHSIEEPRRPNEARIVLFVLDI